MFARKLLHSAALIVILSRAALSAPLPAFADTNCSALTDGAPRGVMCLHCMYSRAKRGVDLLTDAVLQSCRKRPAISFVTDGTWGLDLNIIRSQVAKLASGGRAPLLHLYLINGPAQRRWKNHIFTGWTIMEPRKFEKKLVLPDSSVQKRFISEIKKLLPVMVEAESLGASVSISPGLEDNFSDEGFVLAADLLRSAIPPELKYEVVRSPCMGCYIGNRSTAPLGVLSERHPPGLEISIQDGLIANDGAYFTFSSGLSSASQNKPAKDRLLSNAQIKELVRTSSEGGNSFFLWIGKYQGSKGFLDLTAPKDRKYDLPTSKEISDIVEILAQ